MHSPLLIPLIVVALIFLSLAVAKLLGLLPTPRSGAIRTNVDCYVLFNSMLTPAERSFLGVLDALDLTGYRVYAKVRLADIVGIKAGMNGSARQAALNRITGKHVDFLIVRQDDGAPVLALELDDSSHERADRRERDVFVDKVYASVGLASLHLQARRTYVLADVRSAIEAAMRGVKGYPAAKN